MKLANTLTCALAVSFLVAAPADGHTTQDLFGTLQATRVQTLALGESVERELKGGEVHPYGINLAAGQFVHVVSEQRGVDVIVALIGPDGRKVLEVDRPNGSAGPEELFWVAGKPETYRIEVRSLEATAPAGKYVLKIAGLRQSTDEDRKRLSAQEAFSRGMSLRGNSALAQDAIKSFAASLDLWSETQELSSAAYAAQLLGETYRDSGDSRKAVESYQQALSLNKAAKNAHGELGVLKSLGELCLNLGENEKALAYYQQSLPLVKLLEGQKALAITVNDIGRLYSRLGDYAKAIDSYQRALVLEREVQDRASEAATLSNIGGVYSNVGEYQKSLDYYAQAGTLYEQLEDRRGEAVVANGIGIIHQQRGHDRKALEYFEKAAAVFREIRASEYEAAVLSNIGQSYNHLKEHQKALDAYQKALAMHRASGDRYREAFALNGIGSVYSDSYESDKALDYYRQALELRRRIGDRAGEAVTLFNIGGTYWDLKEYQKSLDHTLRAIDSFKLLGDRFGQAKALYHAGWVYFTTTQYQKAAEYLQQALVVDRALGLRNEEIKTLDTLARAWNNSGEFRKALECVQQKLSLLRDAGDREGIAEATSIIGILYSEVGEPRNALDYLQKALRLYEDLGDKRGQAVTLNGFGWLHYTQGEDQKAAEYYQAALSIWRALRDTERQANVLYNLAELKCSKGAWDEGAKFLAEALDLEESKLAIELLAGAEWQRKFFLQLYVRSLHLALSINARYAPNDADAARLALTTLLRRKGRVLDSMAEEHAALRRNASPETLTLLDQLNHYVSKQSQLKLLGTGDASLREYQARLNESQEKIEEIRLKLNASSFKFRMESRKVSLEEVQQGIPRDAALIEFSISLPFDHGSRQVNKFGKPRYLAYVLFGQGNPSLVDLGDAEIINLLAGKLRALLREPGAEVGEVKKAARELDELIMRPVRQKLGGRTRLLISPDSQLNLIPFAALVDERGNYLVRKYSISYLASGRDLVRLQNPQRSNTPPLIIANPDLEDTSGGSAPQTPGGGKSRSGSLIQKRWSALPGTEVEAKAVKTLIPSALLKVGRDATEAEIKQANAPVLVHFATHGFFLGGGASKEQPPSGMMTLKGSPAVDATERDNPMLRSGLVLAGANQKRSGADDGLLTAAEMVGLNLLGTKLVVLSACETGVGDVEVGEGVYGLRRAIILAGAEAQVMSLWKVDDEVTSKLMVEYYTGLLKKGEGRAEALRAVQLSMLGDQDTQHPYFWAGFIESGAWTGITDSLAIGTMTENP
jgi:CHAT domain-containing protein/tetratricopeptide (TPR) repeat protein